MVICLSVLGYRLAFRDHLSAPLPKALFYLALTGFPTLTWLGYLRGHCAIFIYFFLMLLVIERIFTAEPVHPSLWILFGLLTACGCMSDMQLLIIAVVPVLLFCVLNLLRNEPKFDTKRSVRLAGIALTGTALGMLMDTALMKLGGINKNSFLDTRKFVNMDTLGEKFLLLGKGILNVFRADLPDGTWSPQNIFRLAAAAVIFLTVILCLFSILHRFLKKGEGDPVSVICALSISVMCLVCFFTDIYTAPDSARYISWLPFAAAVLICRSLESKGSDFRLLPCAAAFLSVGLLFFTPPVTKRVETPQDRLAKFLSENGLTEGYADFWNASHTTVAAKDQVRVRAIRGQVPVLGEPDHLEMQNWFCKTEWYRTGSHNFIVFDGSGYLHVSEDVVTTLLGEPNRILETGEYRIYVYDRDLTKEIILPAHISTSQ